MFRVIDVPGMFNALRDVNFNGQNAVIEIEVRDTFCPENAGSTTVEFTDGHPRVSDARASDAKMCLDISDFSSLLMGSIDVRTLQRLGLAEIQSARELELLERIFMFGQMPLTTGGL
jgi:predicted acetyltransferase